MSYPEKYQTLIDEETWAFIRDSETWFPADSTTRTVDEQRKIYNAMCRAFFAGYPDGVSAKDSKIQTKEYAVPVRTYQLNERAGDAEVVYFHGGGFVVGGLDSHDDVCAEICEKTGFRVTSVDYRLAPENTFPDDFHDALNCFEHIAKGSDLPVVVVGDSAGANLAAAISHVTKHSKNKPVGQVLIYPGLDSKLDHGTFLEHAEAPMLTRADTTFYKTVRTGGDAERLNEATCCPLNANEFQNLPPTIVVSAECDPLSGDGKNYCDKITAAGGQATWHNEDGLVHGYLRARHTVKRAKVSFEKIVTSIKALGLGQWPS